VARRPAIRASKSPRRVSGSFKPSSAWPHIEAFIESGGNINIGRIAPIACAAIAADDHTMLAALVRRKAETFSELMARLDQAVDQALNHDAFTDEINS
jgi:hypothetical protein